MSQQIFNSLTAKEMVTQILDITGVPLYAFARFVNPSNPAKIQRNFHRWLHTDSTPSGKNRELLIKTYKAILNKKEDILAYKRFLAKQNQRTYRDLKKIIDRITEAHNISKTFLAEMLGVSRQAMYLWLDGTHRPSPERIHKLVLLDQFSNKETK